MKKPPKIVFDLLRGGISMCIAAILIYMVVRSSEMTMASFRAHLVKSDWRLLIVAFFTYGSAIFLTAWRWQLLLKVQQIDLSYPTVSRLTLIGVFFSLLIPGAVGGDLIKMVYASKRAPNRGTEAVMTIMLDRVIGLIGLCLVTIVAVLLCLDFVLGAASLTVQLAVLFVGAASVGCVGVVAGIYFREPIFSLPWLRRLLDWASGKLPEKVTAIFTRLAKGLDLYRHHFGTLLKALAVSCLVHTVLSMTVWLLSQAYHMQQIAMRFFFFATQLANAIGAIPVTPAGVGSRDGILKATLHDVGRQTGAGPQNEIAGLVTLTFTFLLLAWSLIGGIVFMFSRLSAPSKALAEMHELGDKLEEEAAGK